MTDLEKSWEKRFITIEEKIDKLSNQITSVAEVLQGLFPQFNQTEVSSSTPRIFDGLDLARLPKHLQTTLRCLQTKGQATALEISTITNKERAVESDYLNQLHVMGFVGKKRRKRSMIFFVADANNEETDK